MNNNKFNAKDIDVPTIESKVMSELNTKVLARMNEMVKDPAIQSELLKFPNKEEAQEWLVQTAIATLYLPVEDRVVEEENYDDVKGDIEQWLKENYMDENDTYGGTIYEKLAYNQFCKQHKKLPSVSFDYHYNSSGGVYFFYVDILSKEN